jgi:Tol biopolymer transport system component
MSDLEERFRALGRVGSPDLWTEIEDREPGSARVEPSSGRRWLAGVVAFAVAATGLTFAAVVFRSGDQPRPVSALTNGKIAFSGFDGNSSQIYSVEPDGSGLAHLTQGSDLATATDPAWSPDGTSLAFVVQQFHDDGTTGRSDLWVMRADGSDPRQLTDGPGSSWSPTWSPDGTRIAFASGDPASIFVINADGTGSTRLSEDGVSASDPSWSPDGSRIAFAGKDARGEQDLYVLNTGGAGASLLLSLPGWQIEPTWSPDGQMIAFTTSSPDGAGFGVSVMDADGTNVRSLTDQPAAQSADWSPDGRQVAFMALRPGTDHDTLYVMNADGTEVHELPGLPTEATSPSWQAVPVEATPSVSPTPAPGISPLANGQIYFRVGAGDGPIFIYKIQPDGTGEQPAFDSQPPHVWEVSWSPDGRRIAYADHVVGSEGIYVSNPDGSDAVQLTSGMNDATPSWSPDGAQIVFAGTDPEATRCEPGVPVGCHTDIFVMNADGTGVTRLTGDSAPEFQPVWSPDGKWIAFVRGNQTGIYIMNGQGSDVREVASTPDGSDFSPSWSPDGRRLVYASIRNEDWGIFTIDLENPEEIQLEFGGGYYDDPVWSPDGRLIAFVGNPDGGPASALYVMSVGGSAITRLSTPVLDQYGVAGDIAWQPLPVEQASPNPTEPAPSPSVSEPIPIQSSPGAVSAVTYGFGSVWIASYDGSMQGWITQLDPSSGEQFARISTGDVFPTWEIEGGGLTTGDGSLWLAGAAPARGEPGGVHAFLLRVDPDSKSVEAKVDLGTGSGADVAVNEAGVWVLSFSVADDGSTRMLVSQVDPSLNTVIARIPLDATYGHHIFAVGGRIVAETNETSHAAVQGTVLNIIDPTTAQMTDRVPLGTYAVMAASESDLWAADGRRVIQLDPATGGVLNSWEVLNTGDVLAASQGEAGIWFLGPASRSVIYRFDPRSGQVDLSVDQDPQSTPIAMAVAPDSVWVLNYEGTVTWVALT